MSDEKQTTGTAWADTVGCLFIMLIPAALIALGMLLAYGWRP